MIRSLLGIMLVVASGSLFGYQDNRDVNNLLQLANQNINDNFQKAINEADAALKLSETIDYKEGVAISCFYLGKLYGSKLSDFKKGIYYHEKSMSVARELHDDKLVALNYLSTGLCYYHLGLYGNSLDQLLTSQNIFKEMQDVVNASFALVNIDAIYAESGGGSYSKAIAGFEESLRVAESKKNDSLFIVATSYYATALVAHGQLAEAEKKINKALQLSKRSNKYADFTQMFYVNLGDIFFYGGMLKAAINQYEIAEKICIQNRNKHGQAISSFKKGLAYFQLGEIDLANTYYQQAIKDFKRLNMHLKLVDAYKALTLLEFQRKRFKEAFEFSSQQTALSDSLNAVEMSLLFDAQSQVAEKKINIQQKAQEINWLSFNLVFFVLLVALFFSLIYLNHQRLRAAKSRSSLVNENLILEKELQDKRFQEEKLIQQLEFNAKTLTTNTLNMIQKNEILLQIKEKAEILRTSFPEEFLPIKVKDLIQLVNFGLNIDKDWDNFKIHFEQVHTDFFDQLKAKYPHLNSSDLKLCALLKLNLDTKEIAAIMNISPQSVKVARSRLRKKLELEITSNLSSFITQIQ